MVLEQQLAQLRSQARTRSPGSAGGSRSTSEIVEAKRQAETERETAQRELQTKLDTLTEAHPDVIVARERLKRAQSDVGRFSGQLEKAAGASPGQGASADALEIKAMEGKLADMRFASNRRRTRDPRALQGEVQLQHLRHNLEEARKRLSAVENERVQATVMEKMDSSGNFLRLRIHDPATLAGSPLQSRRRRFAMGGFMLACLLAVGTALGRAMVSDRIFDRSDVTTLGGAPVLAVVPPVPKRLRGAVD